MDVKNATILLMLLLCVLGLIVGVHCSETSDSTLNPDDYDDAVDEDLNETVPVGLEFNQTIENAFDNFIDMN